MHFKFQNVLVKVTALEIFNATFFIILMVFSCCMRIYHENRAQETIEETDMKAYKYKRKLPRHVKESSIK